MRHQFPASTPEAHQIARAVRLAVNVTQIAPEEDTEETYLAVLHAIETHGLDHEDDTLEAAALDYLARGGSE